MTHKYSTPSGELEPTDVRARAVGNAVYVEHVGGCGDIFAWGARDPEAAGAIAGELNAVLNGLRAALADSAKKAGEYAHAARGWLDASRAEVAAYQQSCEQHVARYNQLAEEHDAALDAVRLTLTQLDGLADVWGDEGVFRRCRDRLRAIPGVAT